MVSKSVSFTEDSRNQNDFKTWPKRAIKCFSNSNNVSAASQASVHTEPESMDDLIYDLFSRFRNISDVNVDKCLHYLLSGCCKNRLSGYSVLNMILKAVTSSEVDEDGPVDLELEGHITHQVLERAIYDFDSVCDSVNVLDTRLLQQIMRAVEIVWIRTAKEDVEAASSNLRKFAGRCISLMQSKPNSKTLLGPAIRVANVAMDHKLLPKETVVELIWALSRSHFVFAASFIIEAMLILSTAYKNCPESLYDCEEAWVPLVLRALGSTSVYTRNMAFQLVQYYHSLPLREKSTLLARSLSDSTDYQKHGTEQLCRVLVRKMATVAANSAEDAKMMIQAWCLVLQSASYLEDEWPLLDLWLDVGRVSFSKWPRTIELAWQTICDVQLTNSKFVRALLPPILATQSTDDNAGISKMISEATRFVPKSTVWEDFLEPLFRGLVNTKPDMIISTWSQLLQQEIISCSEKQLSSYTDILGTISKHANQQNYDEVEVIWRNCILTHRDSKSKVMDLIKFHYTMLSQLTSHHDELSMLFSNCLLKWVPLGLLNETPKNSPFAYLTLVFLPIVTFLNPAAEFLDRVLSQCRSQESLRLMLKALLSTVETGNDSRNSNRGSKWSLVSQVIREYIGGSIDHDSVVLIGDTLLAFVPSMGKASPQQWQTWSTLFLHNSDCQSFVLSSLKKLPPQGLRTILLLPKNTFREEKIRLVKSSINDQVFDLLQSDNNLADTDLIDSIARSLVMQNQLEATKWAIRLIGRSRLFVVAKHILTSIEETNNNDIMMLWNTKVEPYLETCPAFVSKNQASRLVKKLPQLKLSPGILIRTTTNFETSASPSSSSSTPSSSIATPKRAHETTPVSSSKRQRRAILTGSMPVALCTPPGSSDPAELNQLIPMQDELCSSPPPRGTLATPQTWRNSQERALTLKRILMGLDMGEASQGMSRSEKQMIYNLMFKSCVWLKTHLAETGSTLSKDEVSAAKQELNEAVTLYQTIEANENALVAKNKHKNEEFSSPPLSEDDDSELDIGNFDPLKPVKLEIA